MSRYGDPGHEEWLIEQEREDERWSAFDRQEVMAEIGRRETEGLDADYWGGPDEDDGYPLADDLPSQREAEALAEVRAEQECEASRERHAVADAYLDWLARAVAPEPF